MRTLMLAPNYRRRVNFGHQLFWDEIGRQTDMVQHGYGNPYAGRSSVKQIFKEKGSFDVVFFESARYCSHYTDLAEVDTIRVALIGDYFGPNVKAYNSHMVKNKPHIVVLQSSNTFTHYKSHMDIGQVPRSQLVLLHHSVDANVFYHKQREKTIDVLAAWTSGGVYRNRSTLLHYLRQMNINLKEGGWRSELIHEKYVDAINTSKMMVCANGTYNEVTMKYLEVMACGTLFVTDEPNDSEWFGFEDGHNIVFYDKADWSEMRARVEKYLSDDKERSRVAENGLELVMSRHTNEVRITELLRQINSVTEGNREHDPTNSKEEDTT